MRRMLKFRCGYTSQIVLYDAAKMTELFTFEYDEAAYRRGYSMTTGAITFFPMIEDGLADISVWEGRPQRSCKFDKRVEAQLSLKSGELCLHDPEEPPLMFSVSPGNYNVVIAQKKMGTEDFLEIDLFLQPMKAEET